LGLKYIDAAETFGILKQDAKEIHINVHHGVYLQSEDMAIYAEKIKAVKRFVSLEEAFELLDAIEAVGFTDIHLSNFIVAEKKIYFIDLESTNFQKHAGYNFMGELLSLVKPEDRDVLWKNIQTRTEVREKWIQDHEKEETERETFEEESRRFFFHRWKSFAFPVAAFIT
ncbi:MAG: hypothetical protein V4487_05585, partial [Chlamydiota bacterium]